MDVDFARAQAAGLDRRLFRKDADAALADPEPSGAVVELIGGVTAARDVIEKAWRPASAS